MPAVGQLKLCPNKMSRSWRCGKVKKEVKGSNDRTVANVWEDKMVSDMPPRPRSGHTIVTHESLGIAIMFGGLGDDSESSDSDPVLNDIWMLLIQEDHWVKVNAHGTYPQPVFGHTAELVDSDPNNLSMIVFGGQSIGGLLAYDTHILSNILNNPTWHKVVDRSGLSLARWGHTMVSLYEPPHEVSPVTGELLDSDEGNLQLIVFGGMADTYESLQDVLIFNLKDMSWSKLDTSHSPKMPIGRRRHIAALDETTNRMWMFGGRSEWNAFHSDIWYLDIATRTWVEVTPKGPSPMPRTGHCGALHNDCLYVFGGFELRVFHGETETGDAATCDWDYVLHNDLSRFNTVTHTWEDVNPQLPSVVRNEAPSSDTAEMDLGGLGRNSKPSGSHSHSTSEQEVQVTHNCSTKGHICPGVSTLCCVPRQRSMAACFLHGNRLYIYGGRDKSQAFHCSFAVPLAPPTRSQPTLVQHLAQYIVDKDIPYENVLIPNSVRVYLDSLFSSPSDPIKPLKEVT